MVFVLTNIAIAKLFAINLYLLINTEFNKFQAKKFVESVPVVVKSDISKEEAEQLKEAIAKAGGVTEIL